MVFGQTKFPTTRPHISNPSKVPSAYAILGKFKNHRRGLPCNLCATRFSFARRRQIRYYPLCDPPRSWASGAFRILFLWCMPFKLVSDYKPAGDQPKAIKALVSGLQGGMQNQTLHGVTGSGKTFTIANGLQDVQRPTLVIAHNKTLAAQLCNEFREFFPDNAVEYFVSYYDYYQPEAYLPRTDTYIEKEAQINDEIDRLRHSTTQSLLSRRDVIVVASLSCLYGLGSPKNYEKEVIRSEE